MSIFLPRSDPPPERQVENAAPPVRRDAAGKMLLVEDDADVRSATRSMLEELGYQVIEADSGDAALRAIAAGCDVDLVFTDVIMASGMTGIEMARAIKTRRPELPVLLTSGYTAQRLVPNAMNGDLPLLRKPYTLSELAKALADLTHTAAA